MEKKNGIVLLASFLFSLVVGVGAPVVAAENDVTGLIDNAPLQSIPAEKSTAKIKKIATKASVKQQTRQITGLVASISGNQLTVKKGNKTFVFQVDEGIVIKSNDKVKSLSDLKTGDKIMAKYIEKDGVQIARSIYLKIDAGK